MKSIHNLSILKTFNTLPPASRMFLLFTGINLISWQCIVGPVLVLFSRAINMPPAWVGMVVSFMPLSMLIVIISIPAVEAFGPRKLLVSTWLVRNIAASLVFAVPLAMSFWGDRAAWYVLIIAILSFSLVRAFGVGAWYPWLHELVPQDKLGTYFSTETLFVQILNVVLAFIIAGILNLGEGLFRFYCVYGIGIMTGLGSVLYLKKIPGGLRTPVVSYSSQKFSLITHAIKDKKYRRFILLSVMSVSALIWLNISSILYLRDILGYQDARIMGFMAAGALGVAVTIQYWARLIARYGSYMTMAILMMAHAIIALSWCGIMPDVGWTLRFVLPLVILAAVFSAGLMIVVSQTMMSHVQLAHKVGYTSLWIIGAAVSNGVPPILAGWLIDHFYLSGYRVCFLISFSFGIMVTFLWHRFRYDKDEKTVSADIHLFFRPMQPLRNLARIVWLILGTDKKER